MQATPDPFLKLIMSKTTGDRFGDDLFLGLTRMEYILLSLFKVFFYLSTTIKKL